MEISLKQFTNDKEKNFDVLDTQVGGLEYKGNKPKVNFEDIPKPTELEPLPPVVKKSDVVLPKVPEKILEKVPLVPKALSTYIAKLIMQGRKLRVLSFDIEDAKTNDDLRKLLSDKCDSGLISEKEKKEMISFLSDASPETPASVFGRTESVSGETKSAESSSEAKETKVVPENRILDTETVRLRRQKMQNLKNNHGIVVGKPDEHYTELENSIIDKSAKLWKGSVSGNDRDMELSQMLLSNSALEFREKVEVSAPFPKSFDGIARKKPIIEAVVPQKQEKPKETPKEVVAEKVKEEPVVKEEVVPTPVQVVPVPAPAPAKEMLKEEKLAKPIEQPKLGHKIIPVEFEGGTVVVERGRVDGTDNNSLKVTLSEKEIAVGFISDKGPKIKIKPEFKAGFLLASTEEEIAFKKAWQTIKDLKME